MTPEEYNAQFARRQGFADGLPHTIELGGILPATDEFTSAVRAFQRKHGLTVDGMFGPASWAQWRKLHGAMLPTDRIIIGGVPRFAPMKVANYLDDRVRRFKRRDRYRDATQIVVHESVTRSAQAAVRVLLKKDLGVHFIIDERGTITQHADVLDDMLIHCPNWNSRSVAIEVINPYYPAYETAPWLTRIAAPWADRHKSEPREYLLPTLAQCQALTDLISTLVMSDVLSIPSTWHGVQNASWYLGAIPSPDKRARGIWSHQQTGTHADGSWPLFVAYLALHRYSGNVESARERAIELTENAIQPVRLL